MMVERFFKVSGAKGGVAEARAWACAQLEGFGRPVNWRPDPRVVALVVSELVTNAVRHASGAVGLRLMWDERRLRIAVDDTSAVLPVVRPARPDLPGGHGMNLVQRLAGGWGAAPRAGGKRVWADLVPGKIVFR
ncbi:ATP-binding protein [Streptomyces sp. H39-S7]|uniref:ATP-binding protein n=1 Tax=Streptomyces sp. H39-S7 TaxID=3004357 RepID=UPI0022AFFD85|nr:ATP-binding protein [Streptomyces sp. H39-S7]MCZ4124703.1 ATP-binding protein [Streptomyces sp. H39-S7]